jgi:choline-sulfatase
MVRNWVAVILVALILGLWTNRCVAVSKPNIVLITLSSVRADHMGFLGSTQKVTPHLDDIARQSLVFELAFAQAPLTVVSHATLLSGTYPQTSQSTEFGATLPNSLPFLPDILHSHGYRTAAFVASIELDPKGGLAPGFDRGFTMYNAGFHRPAKGLSRFRSVERFGTQVVARAISWLAANKTSPFFLWVHLDDADVSSNSSYNPGVAAADAAAGRLLAALRARKLYDSALVVVASDHGQSLGAHGEQTHGIFLYDETIHVPLLCKLPRSQPAKRVHASVSLIDVAPTILEVAHIPVPPRMQGHSLLRVARQGRDEPVYSRSAFSQGAFGWSALESWRAGKFLYIRAPKPELYDLTADPGATHNLAQSSKATLETIASQLAAFDQRLTGQGDASSTSLSSSEIQKLASLGYVGLQKSTSGANTAVTGTDPKDEIAKANLVLAALSSINDGKPEKAASELGTLAAAESKMYLAQYAMGLALAGQQQCSKATEYLRNAIELQPDSAWAHYEMGACLVKTGKYRSAAVHLQIACKRLPEFAAARSLLDEAQRHSGRVGDTLHQSSNP